MSADNVSSTYRAITTRPGHLAVVTSSSPVDTDVRPGRTGRATGTSYGEPVGHRRVSNEAAVRAIAAQYATFEDALLPMVLAAGVAGEAAADVAAAILSNPALRAQSERAYQRARMTAL